MYISRLASAYEANVLQILGALRVLLASQDVASQGVDIINLSAGFVFVDT